MRIFGWFQRRLKRKGRSQADDGDATQPDSEEGDETPSDAMIKELQVDPHFSVPEVYVDIFSRLPSSNSIGQACEDFERQLRENRVEALMAVLAWTGDCSGMDCNSFLFAVYDEWFEPLTPKVLWKIHIANGFVDTRPGDEMFNLMPLAQVIGESITKGREVYISQLEASAPSGAGEHFGKVVRRVRELFA